MQTKTFLITFLIIFSFVLTACTPCETGVYTDDGKCCNHICTLYCENGYKEGSCGCECASPSDLNIDDIFDDNGDINPPVIPN